MKVFFSLIFLREKIKKLFEYEKEIGSIVKGRSYPIVIQEPKV